MLKIEKILQDLLAFLTKLWGTFRDSIFRPQRFMDSLYRRGDKYGSPYLYLIICIICCYISEASQEALTWAGDGKTGNIWKIYHDYAGFSILDMLLIAAPIALLYTILLRIVVIAVSPARNWRRFFFQMGIYWFASVQFLIAIAIVALAMIELIVQRLPGRLSLEKSDKIYQSLHDYVVWLFFLILFLPAVGAIIRGLRTRFYLFFRMMIVIVVAIVGSMVAGSGYSNWLENIRNDAKNPLKRKYPSGPLHITILNSRLERPELYFFVNNDTPGFITLSTDCMIENNEDRPISIGRNNYVEVSFIDRDSVLMESYWIDTHSYHLAINNWQAPKDAPVMIIQPGQLAWLQLSVTIKDRSGKFQTVLRQKDHNSMSAVLYEPALDGSGRDNIRALLESAADYYFFPKNKSVTDSDAIK